MGFLALTPPVAWQAFPFGFGEKKDRGTGFSVLAAQEMEREPKNERWGGGRKGKKLFQTNPGF